MNKKLIGNIFFSLTDRGMGLLFGMVISIFITRYLGAEDFGKYTYFGVIYAIVASFANFGMQQIVTKELAAKTEKQKDIICATLILAAISSALTWIGINVIQYFTGFLESIEIIFLGVLCIFNICTVFQYYLISIYQMKNIVLLKNILLIIMLIIYGISIVKKFPVLWFELIYTIKESCMLGIFLIAYLISKERDKFRLQRVEAGEVIKIISKLIKLCFPLMLAGLSVTLYLKIDQLMIKEMLNEVQLGIYSSGIKFVEIFFNLPSAVTIGVLPYFSAKYLNNREDFWDKYKKLASGLNFCAYVFAIMLTIFGKWLINLVYGVEYTDAGIILIIYVWSTVAVCMGCVRGIYLSILEYSKLSFVFSVLSAAVNILINYLLIPIMGIKGAAVASIISYFLQSFIFTSCCPSLRKIFKIQCWALYGFIFYIKDIKRVFRTEK